VRFALLYFQNGFCKENLLGGIIFGEVEEVGWVCIPFGFCPKWIIAVLWLFGVFNVIYD